MKNIRALAIFTPAVLAVAVCAVFGFRSPLGFRHLIKELQPGFPVDGHLYRCSSSKGHADDVCIESLGLPTAVWNITDLKGRVHLRNATDTLNFVRFRSSPGLLSTRWDGVILEVMPVSAVTSDVALGNDRWYHQLRKDTQWHDDIRRAVGPDAANAVAKQPDPFGVVPDAWFKDHKLKPPTIVATLKGWHIERTVMTKAVGGVNMWQIGEDVTPEGGYAWTKFKLFRFQPPGSEDAFKGRHLED